MSTITVKLLLYVIFIALINILMLFLLTDFSFMRTKRNSAVSYKIKAIYPFFALNANLYYNDLNTHIESLLIKTSNKNS